MRHEESRIQTACVEWFRFQFPKFHKLLFAVPNGGRRGIIEATRMKGEGVVPGVSDLLFLYPSKGYHGLCIEMKTKRGRQSKEQKIWQAEVQSVGYKYVICRSIEDFMEQVKIYLM